MSKEEWRNIVGFPDYEVSDLGSVRSWKSPNGRGSAKSPRCLTQVPFKGKKYLRVALTSFEGKVFHKRVHRLVLEAFVGPCPEGMEGCHNDGNPENNTLGNLRWGTPKENMQDQTLHETRISGETHPNVVLSDDNIKEIRDVVEEIRKTGKRDKTGIVRKLAEKFNVSIYSIYSIASYRARSAV